jgi:hypothetical protein
MNTNVRLLTPTQAEALFNRFFAPNSQYNPVLDGLGRWIISEEEVEQTTNPDFLWLKTLEIIEYVAPDVPFP